MDQQKNNKKFSPETKKEKQPWNAQADFFVCLFSTSVGGKGQFIITLCGEDAPESSIGLKVQLVLLVQRNISGCVVIGTAITVKTQCSVWVMYRILFHGFKKDLGPGL